MKITISKLTSASLFACLCPYSNSLPGSLFRQSFDLIPNATNRHGVQRAGFSTSPHIRSPNGIAICIQLCGNGLSDTPRSRHVCLPDKIYCQICRKENRQQEADVSGCRGVCPDTHVGYRSRLALLWIPVRYAGRTEDLEDG